MAKHLENGTYVVDETERQAYTPAARMLERLQHCRLDLAQPLGGFDYLLVMCAHLIVGGKEDVDGTLTEILNECTEERRRQTRAQ